MPDTVFLSDRMEVTRPIPAPASAIFDILRSPAGHVAIDASGMLQDFTGQPAEKVGDTFVIHMDRESLNDFPLGKYDVTVHIITFERDKEIAWNLKVSESSVKAVIQELFHKAGVRTRSQLVRITIERHSSDWLRSDRPE